MREDMQYLSLFLCRSFSSIIIWDSFLSNFLDFLFLCNWMRLQSVSCFHGHPSAYRPLDWFHFLAVVNRASVNIETGGSVVGFALLCYTLRTSSTAGSHVSGGAGVCATVTLISIDSVSVCSHQLWAFFPHVFSSTCCHWGFIYCVFVCFFTVLVSTCAPVHGMVGMWSWEDSL